MLASCYRQSLKLASQHPIQTLAFPAISCGVYGYPIDQACAIAMQEVQSLLQAESTIDKVIFCCFNAAVECKLKDILPSTLS